MDVTFGSVADTAPEGFLPRRLHFKQLVALDTGTIEGPLTRVFRRDGGGTRDLPIAITGLGPNRGHADAVPVGRVDQITMHETEAEGWGWLVNDDNGRLAFHELDTQMVRGNSVEMVDTRYRLTVDLTDEGDIEALADFSQWKIGATTIVMKPAYGDSRATIEEEITAALAIEGDLVVDAPFAVVVPDVVLPDLTASGRIVMPHYAFEVPEPDDPQVVSVSDDGSRISFHLGVWDECHTGFVDRCVRIPRSRTNYSSFNKNRVLTDRGHVYTGPLILLGGHDATREAINKALAQVENVVADVVVRDGRIGPWACGVIRPGATPEAVYAAAASRVSGHWLRGELFAICSAPTEGFNVRRATEYEVELGEDNDVEYLAASFAFDCGCDDPGTPSSDDYDAVLAAARAALEDDDADASQEGSTESVPEAA